MFALVDCNNFFASCERVFRPDLEKTPVIVLSNNDGCVIARSNEAKALGIKMGTPFYQLSPGILKANNIAVFSSNYALYGDMSSRVMSVLASFSPEMEIYSIDEAFLNISRKRTLEEYAVQIRKTVKQWTGMPVSIGLGATKTLAKLANHIAKKETSSGVFLLKEENFEENLAPMRISEIWGVGRRLTKKLEAMGLRTALQLRNSDIALMQKKFSVCLARTISELNGNSCIPLEEIEEERKSICSSKSFGRPVYRLEEIKEAVATYAATAAKRLREEKLEASHMIVFIQTNFFNKNAKQNNASASVSFPCPANDDSTLTRHATKAIEQVFKDGYKYKKAGVILTEISKKTAHQADLFDQEKDNNSKLSEAIDKINKRFGSRVVYYASEGVNKPWNMKQSHRSNRYTTNWKELPSVQ
jgi:DNA polymerase V